MATILVIDDNSPDGPSEDLSLDERATDSPPWELTGRRARSVTQRGAPGRRAASGGTAVSVIRVEPRGGRNYEVEIAEETAPGASGLTFSYQVRVDDTVVSELGLDPDLSAQPPGAAGGVAYWGVANADEAWARLLKQGATPASPVREVGGGIRVATVKDPFGNVFAIIENPHFPNTAT